MNLRWRLIAALGLVGMVAVAGVTGAHVAEVSRRLREQLHQQLGRMVTSIETEMTQTGELLDAELQNALDPAGSLARSLTAGSPQARFFAARTRLQSGRLEILKILRDDGVIATSGHWPASFGAVDAQFHTYLADPGASARLIDEAIPTGSAPSMQRWAEGRWGNVRVLAVAGRFLDEQSLEQMRARVGADLLALCRPEAAVGRRVPCHTVKNPELPIDGPFRADSEWGRRLVLARVPISAGADPPMLIVGLDRDSIDQVQGAIVQRAMVVGVLSILLALGVGVFLARRLVRPVEALAAASARLAGGDLHTRVAEESSAGPEVRRLMMSFNRMAADIERSQTRLRQAERVAAWQEIARGLAHELKNPLTPILGAMDVLRRARRLGRADFDEILEEQAEAVVEEVMRLKELADAFSRFARLPEPRFEPIALAELVDHAIALYVPEDGRFEVLRDFEAALPSWQADRTQLMTILTNLVKNAVEAMESHGRLRIGFRRVPRPGEVEDPGLLELRVEDSGPGIDPELRERLFTPYVTTKGSRGTGLGLALVHRIVAEHAGQVEVLSTDLGGACFRVLLPWDIAARWRAQGPSSGYEGSASVPADAPPASLRVG